MRKQRTGNRKLPANHRKKLSRNKLHDKLNYFWKVVAYSEMRWANHYFKKWMEAEKEIVRLKKNGSAKRV